MKTTYTNLYDKEIKVQQITSDNQYYKVFKDDDDKLIKKEFYGNNKLMHTYFYIDLGSSHQDILSSNNKDSIVIIELEKINDNYSKHFGFEYLNRVLKNKDLSIYNNDGICLMVQHIDMNTNLPLYNETSKYYEDSNNGYEFEFNYHISGKLAFILVSNFATNFYEPYRPDELNMIPNFEWWDQYSSYYLNAEPAVPNGVIIV
jgi:hypothetical protein